ncbi:ATP-binding cassette, subfamily B, multidrug efflux pump [Pseudooceanicola antarcticus]|uniref:ABC transporter ATP-binding protein n=1 Tax=Pseudooceanicola antarcticus TaxID=1247613 RepID=A0A285J6Z0_9RHOB|nr:ABC transporter ATP-binding protein [Pseudooceanicola antarcticus]PJE26999.1 ABC transporter ATP-binding protein [Pseudooceanicola antarcticus]SNY56085.1 ATP-binding cassette, subfamily B, multidrug efflux pump [Pseudooceanicola antarcticus]
MFRVFERLIDPFQPFPAETPPTKLMPYMWSQLRSLGGWLPLMAFTSLLVALGESLLFFYAGRIVDLMTGAGPDGFWSQHGGETLLVALALLLLRPAVIGINHLLLEQTLVGTLNVQSQWRAHKHLLGQSMSFFQNDFAGRLSNRVMQLGPATEDSAYIFLEAIWFSAVYIIGATLVVTQINPWLALLLVSWLVLYIFYMQFLVRRITKAAEKWSDGRSAVTGRVVDAYANIEAVKLFAGTKAEETYALSAFKRLQLRVHRFLRLATEMQVVLNLLNGYLMVSIGGLAVLFWSKGLLSVGEVTAAIALTMRLNGMSGWILWVTIRLFEHFGVIREGLRSIAVAHSVVDAPEAPALVKGPGEIRFEDVSHHYGKRRGGLDHVDLTIRPGEKVGLVGPSGAGKSTLISLLLRFRDVEQGRILIDGQDIGAVTQESLRHDIGVVSQDNSLLHRSIRANLLYARPDATEEMMIAAARQAEAHDFIQGLEDREGRRGYNAQVGERGVRLSGGQRQRIAIARMILKDAPIVILDEATSALDSEVEAAIQRSLQTAMEGKTVIAIAHRLSTLAEMDRIVVMERGRIVEDGSHADLLRQEGLYARLWTRQSGGFLADTAE